MQVTLILKMLTRLRRNREQWLMREYNYRPKWATFKACSKRVMDNAPNIKGTPSYEFENLTADLLRNSNVYRIWVSCQHDCELEKAFFGIYCIKCKSLSIKTSLDYINTISARVNHLQNFRRVCLSHILRFNENFRSSLPLCFLGGCLS